LSLQQDLSTSVKTGGRKIYKVKRERIDAQVSLCFQNLTSDA